MDSDGERTLLVLRHAKAADEPGVNDADRPLTGRGRRDAAAAGKWLLSQSLVPQRVLCSSALRTRQTWQEVAAALGEPASRSQVRYDPRAYHADETDLLDLVRGEPAEVGTVLIVGHNPAAHQFAADLTGQPDLTFPTCALAVIRVSGDWMTVASASAQLIALWSPRHTPT